METIKPLKNLTEAKIEKIKELNRDEIPAPLQEYIIAMANMSRRGAQIYAVSVDAGAHWADIRPALATNCQYNSVQECNAHNQYSQIATVNCGSLIRLAIKVRYPDGTGGVGQYSGSDSADCATHRGALYGFTD